MSVAKRLNPPFLSRDDCTGLERVMTQSYATDNIASLGKLRFHPLYLLISVVYQDSEEKEALFELYREG